MNFLKNGFSDSGAAAWNSLLTYTFRQIHKSNTLIAANKLINTYLNEEL